jgi:hypothetical protein
MSKLITLKIDVTKISKDRLYEGKKGKYLDCDVWIDETADEEWKVVSVNESQTKEERDMNPRPKKNYIGNGALKFGWEGFSSETPKRSTETSEAMEEEVPF